MRGADQTTVGYDVPTITCVFCGSRNVNPDAHRTRLIEPAGVLPFHIPREQATQHFLDWIGSSWLAPFSLKSRVVLDNLHGLYLPARATRRLPRIGGAKQATIIT